MLVWETLTKSGATLAMLGGHSGTISMMAVTRWSTSVHVFPHVGRVLAPRKTMRQMLDKLCEGVIFLMLGLRKKAQLYSSIGQKVLREKRGLLAEHTLPHVGPSL